MTNSCVLERNWVELHLIMLVDGTRFECVVAADLRDDGVGTLQVPGQPLVEEP